MCDIPLSPIKLDIHADATPAVCETTEWIKSSRKGLSKLFTCICPERLRKRIQYAELSNAQHEKNLHDVRNGKLTFDEGTRTLQRTLSSAYKEKEIENILKIANLTAKLLADTDDSEIDDNPVSADFFNRWRREAEIIEDEDIQQIWAKLLAEEVKKKGSISGRTLEKMRAINADEARAFSQVLRSHLDGFIVAVDEKGLVNRKPLIGNISQEMLLVLEDIGLIQGVTGLGLTSKISNNNNKSDNKKYTYYLQHNKNYGITVEYTNSFSIDIIRLTPTGQELALIAFPEHSPNDLLYIANEIKKKNPAVKCIQTATITFPNPPSNFN